MRNRAKRGIVLERCYVWLTFKHRILLREKEVRTNVKHCKNPCRAPEKEFQKVVLKYWRRFGLKPEKILVRLVRSGGKSLQQVFYSG